MYIIKFPSYYVSLYKKNMYISHEIFFLLLCIIIQVCLFFFLSEIVLMNKIYTFIHQIFISRTSKKIIFVHLLIWNQCQILSRIVNVFINQESLFICSIPVSICEVRYNRVAFLFWFDLAHPHQACGRYTPWITILTQYWC